MVKNQYSIVMCMLLMMLPAFAANALAFDKVKGSGFGGNEKIGKLIYDGEPGHVALLDMYRENQTCYLQNDAVVVKDYRDDKQVMRFPCEQVDVSHHNSYWDGERDAVNGAFSPSHDALFAAMVVHDLYQQWYGMPVLVKDGQPIPLPIVVHHPMEDAIWNYDHVLVGDSKDSSEFYPFASLDVIAHELAHGFTAQHSNLVYQYESGALNESFSDMSSKAAEYFLYGHNTWELGFELMKSTNKSLRYMDKPSKDCVDVKPNQDCSVDDATAYHDRLNVHYGSGVFNRVFYLLSTSSGWTTKKAYDVMVQANRYYWTSTTSFEHAACGVIQAAKDYHYDVDAVLKAFATVAIDTTRC